MSGLIRGKIECVYPSLGGSYYWAQNIQAIFTNLYLFFIGHPNYSLIASYYGVTTQIPGSAGGSGSGTGYFNNPAGSWGFNAFFVVRANATAARPYDVYHMFQWSGPTNFGSPSFGTSTGTTALIQGSNSPQGGSGVYLGHAAAIGIGGTGGSALSPFNGNPWKGTSNANGTDTKASVGPIWGAPSGGGTGVIIFPRSNNNHGTYQSQAQNMALLLYYTGNNGTRYHIVADDDSWCLAIDYTDASVYNLSYSGIYQPRTNLTIPYPYVVMDGGNAALPWSYAAGTVFGTVAGNGTYEGGIVNTLTGSSAGLQLDHYSAFTSLADFWPNKQFGSPGTWDMLDMPIGIYEEMSGQNYSGLMGQIDFIRECFNIETNGVLSDYTRIAIGPNTQNAIKYMIPWDKETKTQPRSGVNIGGYNFVAPSLPSLS